MQIIDKVWQSDGNIRKQSTITVAFDQRADDILLICAATTVGEVVLETKMKLLRIKMPQKLEVRNYRETFLKMENEVLNLECMVQDGVPPTSLAWLLNGDLVDEEMITSQANETFQLSILSLPMKRFHNKAVIRCQVQSRFPMSAPMTTKDMKLTVVFPPSKVTIDRLPSTIVSEHQTIDYHCTSDESNPPTTLSWRIQYCHRGQNCTTVDLTGGSVDILTGPKYHGYLKRSIIRLTIGWQMHESMLMCSSTYSYNNKLLSSLDTAMPIFVSFTPKFLNFQNGSEIFMKLGVKNQSILVKMFANPEIIQIKWSFANKSGIVLENKSQLFFPTVQLFHMQGYTLTAKNHVGVSTLKLFVNVTYGPKIVGESVVLYRNTSQNAELECLFESNPPPQFSFVKWKMDKRDFEFSDVFEEVKQRSLHCNQGYRQFKKMRLFVKCRLKTRFLLSSSLIIYDASPGDVGFYRCIVSDNYGQIQIQTIGLVLITIPRFILVVQFAKVALLAKSKSKATCLLYSEPYPIVSITVIEKHISQTVPVEPTITRVSTSLYIITVTFHHAQISNKSQIIWKASNSLGHSYQTIPLVLESAPDPPVIVSIHYLGTNSIILEWVQSFDGGYSQSYEIYWRPASYNESRSNMVEIPGNYTRKNMVFTIADLSSNSDYEVTLCSINRMHGRCHKCPKRNLKRIQLPGTSNANHRSGDFDISFSLNLKIVIAVAAFVFGLICLTISVVALLFKRMGASSGGIMKRNMTNDSTKATGDVLISNVSSIDTKLECFEISASDSLVNPTFLESDYHSKSTV